MEIRFNYDFTFPFTMQVFGHYVGEETTVEGRAQIARYEGDKSWHVEDWFVLGTRERDYHRKITEQWLCVSLIFGAGQLSALRDAMQRELNKPEHRASIEDMLRQMDGADAVGDVA